MKELLTLALLLVLWQKIEFYTSTPEPPPVEQVEIERGSGR